MARRQPTGLQRVSQSPAKCHVFVDFDGTIATCDVTDFLLDRFASPEWHEIEADWQAGRIGSRECLARQVALMRATPEEIDGAIAEIEIDPGFTTFVRECRAHDIATTIVSDGFDRVISAVLRRHDVSVPFAANRLEAVGSDGWRLGFPHEREDCRARAGHCKCASARLVDRRPKVVVGDGRSDFCLAGEADLVFAKSKLLELCRSASVTHEPFADFFDVTERLVAWVEQRSRDVVSAPRQEDGHIV